MQSVRFAQNKQKMKKLFLSVGLLAAITFIHAQQLVTPQPSPTQVVKQNFGIGSIELNYSRPGVKGRTVFGDLVPYNNVWRTGANNATTLTFSDDVTISGTTVKAGKYGLLSIPGEKEWTVIITKDVNVNQPSLYKKENDVVRVMARPVALPFNVETFTIQFADLTSNSCNLQIIWGQTAVMLPITTNTDAKVMVQIDNIFNKDTKPYFGAASYYYEAGKDLPLAKTWIDKALADPANAKAYYMYLLKARIHEKMGDKAGAKLNAEKTITFAKEAKNADYEKMAADLIKKL